MTTKELDITIKDVMRAELARIIAQVRQNDGLAIEEIADILIQEMGDYDSNQLAKQLLTIT